MKFRHRELAEPVELGIQMPAANGFSAPGTMIVVVYPSGESFSLPLEVARLIFEPVDARADEWFQNRPDELAGEVPKTPAEEFQAGLAGVRMVPNKDGSIEFAGPVRRGPAPVRVLPGLRAGTPIEKDDE